MKAAIKFSILVLGLFLMAATANAQGHLASASVFYDARDYEEFIHGRGGSEGHSGAYIKLQLGVTGYDLITRIRATAEHEDTKFEVTLWESPCWDTISQDVDKFFQVWLRPSSWMTGEWTFVLKYKIGKDRYKEKMKVFVPRFNYPPTPTGIQLAFLGEPPTERYLVWNRIGDPEAFGKHVEYRVRLLDNIGCIIEDLRIRPGGDPYELWSGNRIAVPLPPHWTPGNIVRIENRVYDDNYPGGPYRFDRACKDLVLPFTMP